MWEGSLMTSYEKCFSQMSVLYVDSDERVRDSMGAFFESWGGQFQAVDSAKAGWSLIENKEFDVVMAEFHLPEVDGLEFLDSIQYHTRLKRVLVSEHGNHHVHTLALRMGVNEILEKPLNAAAIVTVLERLSNEIPNQRKEAA
jgi:DNA-binding NtrC family response regulator